MKAFVIEQFGGIKNLLMRDINIPDIKAGEVLIKTKAIGINPVDYKTRQGYGAAKRLTLPIILGWDIAGEVVKINDNSHFKIGDKVFGMINFPENQGKTYAEYVVAPEQHIVHKLENISFIEAGAFPLAALTAYQALIKKANIQKENRILIQGAAGGVGHFAVQFAKNVGAYVIATASTNHKQFLLDLGVDQFIDYTKENFEEKVNNIDIALDCVGGIITKKTMSVVKNGGVFISTPAPINEELKFLYPKIKTHWILVHADKKDMKYVADLVKAGKLKVHIERIFPFKEIGKAQYELEHNHYAGKVVVVL